MFGSKKKKEAVAENTWKPSAGAVRAPRGSIVVTSTGQKLIRGNRTSFGHAITEAAGQVGGVPPGKTPIAPRGYVDLYDMVRRLKSHGKTDFKAAEFAWWWKLMVDEEETCFQAVTWLLEIAVAHLKTGKGDQDVLALIGNSVALLYLHGYLNLTASATASAVDCYGKLMMLLQGFDDKEARDRTPVEMCVVDLIAKIKSAANGQRRPLYTDLQDYTSFGALDGLASQMTGSGGNGAASAAAMSLLMSSRSWFDMPLKYGFSWFWPRLVSSLDDEAEMNQVFTRIKSFLERHGESLGSTSRVQILVLIMLLREFITLRPTADVNWLCATIEAIKPYYRWPRPYSLIARQLLEDLSRECLCPGSALRRRLRLEHPDLSPSVQADSMDAERDPAMTIGDLTPGHGMVHVMYDAASPLANTYKQFFDMPAVGGSGKANSNPSNIRESTNASMLAPSFADADKKIATKLLRSVKEAILLQMLSFEFDLSSEAGLEDPLSLGTFSDEIIDGWYAQACAVEKRVEALALGSFGERISITKIVRESLLGALLAQIQPDDSQALGHRFALMRCVEEGHASPQRRPSNSRIPDFHAPDPSKASSSSMAARSGLRGSTVTAAPPVAPAPAADGSALAPVVLPAGFHNQFHFYVPNLDFRFWPTDSNRLATWSSLDKVRDKMAEAMQNAGRGRLRKTASNLVLGKGTTGNFSVIMANDLCEAEDEELGTENNGDEEEYEEYLPKAKVPILFFSEDVDILEHLCEAALDAMERGDKAQGQSDLRNNDFLGAEQADGEVSASGPKNGGSNNAPPVSAVKPVVKLVVMGDNPTVHRFVLAYFAFQRTNPRLHKAVRMQTYLVPLCEDRNDLASFLASNDPWYQRHVFSAFAGGTKLAPRYTASEAMDPEVAKELRVKDVLPVTKLSSLLQDYTRIATQEVPICAFECLCWTGKGAIVPPQGSASASKSKAANLTGDRSVSMDPDSPDLVIPFVTSAQIGFMVDLAMYRKATAESRQKQGHDKCHSVRDVLKDEGFPSARLPYKPVDLLVAASPPTMHSAASFGPHSDHLPPEEDAAAARTEVVVDVANAELEQSDLSGTASAIANGINGEGPTAKKYTSLLFTNVAGCFSDEVLAEELDSLDEMKIKELVNDPLFSSEPTFRDLRMHAREWDTGKSKDILSLKTLKGSSFSGRDPVDALLGHLKDEVRGPDAVQKQVGEVSIEAVGDGDMFGVMLDGVVHGPFKRVVLRPMYQDGNGTLARVPFMTFLPSV